MPYTLFDATMQQGNEVCDVALQTVLFAKSDSMPNSASGIYRKIWLWVGTLGGNLWEVSSQWVYALVAVLMLLWVSLAWVWTSSNTSNLEDIAYQDASGHAHLQLDAIAAEIDSSLKILRSVPYILSREIAVKTQLKEFASNTERSKLPYDERKRLWSEASMRSGLQSFLAVAATGLSADVIWIVNAAGD